MRLDLTGLQNIPFSGLDCKSKTHAVDLGKVAVLEGGFYEPSTGRQLKAMVRRLKKPISLLIADVPYGCTTEPWDAAWKEDDFRQCVEIVKHCNPNHEFGDCVMVWFLSDQQLPIALSVVHTYDMSFRLKVWTKPPVGKAKGKRLRQNHENILIVWKGTESDLVKHIDPNDPSR